MKKNISLMFVLMLSFHVFVLPMELEKKSGAAPGIGKYSHNNSDEEFQYNEFAPALSASQAFLSFLEDAQMGADEKVDAAIAKSFSFTVDSCIKLWRWFMQD